MTTKKDLPSEHRSEDSRPSSILAALVKRALSDSSFRKMLRHEPSKALQTIGAPVTTENVAALSKVDWESIEAVARLLDGKEVEIT